MRNVMFAVIVMRENEQCVQLQQQLHELIYFLPKSKDNNHSGLQ